MCVSFLRKGHANLLFATSMLLGSRLRHKPKLSTAGTPGVPDYKCCGIGFTAQKYDANNQACCEDGSVAASEADCFLL